MYVSTTWLNKAAGIYPESSLRLSNFYSILQIFAEFYRLSLLFSRFFKFLAILTVCYLTAHKLQANEQFHLTTKSVLFNDYISRLLSFYAVSICPQHRLLLALFSFELTPVKRQAEY